MVLSEAAKKAFMCYQRSAAEAAAHPSTAEPAAEQATPLQVLAVLCISQSLWNGLISRVLAASPAAA